MRSMTKQELELNVAEATRLAEHFYNMLNAESCENNPEMFDRALVGAYDWGCESLMYQEMLDQLEVS